jgi:hypothetical protein
MNRKLGSVFAGMCGFAALLLSVIPIAAQTQEIKPKPPMYSYVANWQVPRTNWGDMEKTIAPVSDILDKAQAEGLLVGHGSDTTLLHTAQDSTHDVWWSSMSMAGLLKALDRIHGSSTYTNSGPALNDSKHWDEVWVSRYYNWKPGAYKGAYTQVMGYKLKDDAPDDALDNLSQHLVVPVLEKLLSDGTLIEYEIDTMAEHTEAPGIVMIVALTPSPDGIDTIRAAILGAQKDHPLGIQAFGSVTDSGAHRDELLKSDGVYK